MTCHIWLVGPLDVPFVYGDHYVLCFDISIKEGGGGEIAQSVEPLTPVQDVGESSLAAYEDLKKLTNQTRQKKKHR